MPQFALVKPLNERYISSTIATNTAVLQGTVLAPTLVSIKRYADDTPFQALIKSNGGLSD